MLLVAACSTSSRGPEWVHPQKEELELKTDIADCERFFGSSERQQEQCLEAKGWKRARRR